MSATKTIDNKPGTHSLFDVSYGFTSREGSSSEAGIWWFGNDLGTVNQGIYIMTENRELQEGRLECALELGLVVYEGLPRASSS